MAMNLLDLLSNAVSPEIVQGLSRSIGERDSAVRSGVSSLLPTVLAGLASKSSTSTGASNVTSMLTSDGVDSGLLSGMGNLLGGGQTGSLIQLGTSQLSGLFGSDKVAGLGSALATVSGMKASSAGSLASLIVPLAFAVLKKFIGDNRLDAAGVASALAGQRDHLAGKLDPRLTSALGLGAPASLLAGLSAGVAAVPTAASPLPAMAAKAATGAGAAVSGTARPVGAAATAAPTMAPVTPVAANGGGLGRWLPWIIAAAVLAFLLPQLKNCGGTPKAAAPVATAPAAAQPAPAASPAAAAPTPANSTATATTPAVAAAAPAVATTTAPTSAASGIAVAWPAKIYFDTGKGSTGTEGQVTIKAVAAALAAAPATKVALTGYTDRAGNTDANAKLAKDRAIGVRDALKAAGVAEDRIAMQPPVFVEASKSGNEAESRRVDINTVN